MGANSESKVAENEWKSADTDAVRAVGTGSPHASASNHRHIQRMGRKGAQIEVEDPLGVSFM